METKDRAEVQEQGAKLHRAVLSADINRRFTYHPPKPGQPEKYQRLRDEAKALALRIAELVPDSREQALALTALEECVMWANAGIARRE